MRSVVSWLTGPNSSRGHDKNERSEDADGDGVYSSHLSQSLDIDFGLLPTTETIR